MTTELYCYLKQLFSCFLASTMLQDEVLVSKLSSDSQCFEDFKLLHLKQTTITDFFSFKVHGHQSHDFINFVPIVLYLFRHRCSERQSWVIRWLCSHLQNVLNFYVFVPVCRFHQVNNLTQTWNRLYFTGHRPSITILKFLGSCMLHGRLIAEAGPTGFSLRESWL